MVPFGTEEDSQKNVKEFINNYNGEEYKPEVKVYKSQVLSGSIKDTSFVPEEADKECSSFHWMTILYEEGGWQAQKDLVQAAYCLGDLNEIH